MAESNGKQEDDYFDDYDESVSSDVQRPRRRNSQDCDGIEVTVDDVGPRPKMKTVFTAGRPPWYTQDGQLQQGAFVLGICGGSASGKTSVARAIIEELGMQWVVLLSLDSFYKPLDPEEIKLAQNNNYNFDHPDAFDYDLLIKTLRRLKEGKRTKVPIYDFTIHNRLSTTQTVYGANVIIFEGILSFNNKELRDMMDMKLFVETEDDTRLARRLVRDISERGRDLEGVLTQYLRFVKPAFDEHIAPMMKYADVVVPRGAENTVGIDLIVRHVQVQLKERGFNFRAHLGRSETKESALALPSVHALTETAQIKLMHTIIRNRSTKRDDFIFYSQRLMRLLIEEAIGFLPFDEYDVMTPMQHVYRGLRFNGTVCGVSIVRAGVTMEESLRDVCQDAPLGKLLIQSDANTGEPQLHYCQLPKSISRSFVFLMDATAGTGAAAIMAIRVLLDHEVDESNIMFVTVLMAPAAVHNIAYAFPKVKIITSEIDRDLDENLHIVPGIGNFGDLYYGTGA